MADAIAQIENSAEDSTIAEMMASGQRIFFFPRPFVIERVWKTILPTIRPDKRIFIAAVQAKKTVRLGIGTRKSIIGGDKVNSSIALKIEKTGCIKDLINFIFLTSTLDTHKLIPETGYKEEWGNKALIHRWCRSGAFGKNGYKHGEQLGSTYQEPILHPKWYDTK